MERDKHIAVVTDSATSIRQESLEAKKFGVTIVPLEVKFWEKDKYVPYSDADITSEIFYQRMRSTKSLPQSTGALPGRFVEVYNDLKDKYDRVISIHITSKLSGVWQSAIDAKEKITEDPNIMTEFNIIDTGLVSLATWFPVEAAANLSNKGASMQEVTDEVKEVIEKTSVLITLETFENLKKGGRGKDLADAVLASVLSIYPVIGFDNGYLKRLQLTRSAEKSRKRMVEMVGDAGKLAKIALVHTNSPEVAQRVKDSLGNIYKGNIPIYEAGPVLGVHAGEGAIGIAFQKF